MKRRTGLLFSSAVVLGLAGGAVGGFLVQRARPVTPLPPLRQELLAATAPGTPDPRDPKTDDGAKLDGDLRAVLLAKPAGAKDTADFAVRDWFTIGDLAEYYVNPAAALGRLNELHFRRAARTGWTAADGTVVEIDLIQFHSGDAATSYCAMTHFPVDPTVTVDGTATGTVGRYSAGVKDADGRYSAYGLVRHGDVVEQVFMSGKLTAPPTSEVTRVTENQADLL